MAPMLAAVTVAVIVQFVAGQQPSRPGVQVRFRAPTIVQGIPLSKASRVFQTPLGTHQLPQESVTLCTTPILRAPANVDPKIVVEPPKNDAKIRTIDVGKCVERTSR